MSDHPQLKIGLTLPVAVLMLLLTGCGGSSRVCLGCGDSFLIADADAPIQVASGSQVILDASDSEGDIDDYNWIQLLGPPVAISNPGSRRASFIAPEVNVETTLAFRLTITNDFGGSNSDRVGINVVPRLQQAVAIGSALVLDQLKPKALLNAAMPSAKLTLPVSIDNQMVYLGLWMSILAEQPLWAAQAPEPGSTTLRLDEVRALVSTFDAPLNAPLNERSRRYLQQGFTKLADAVAHKEVVLAEQLRSLLSNSELVTTPSTALLATASADTQATAKQHLLRQTADGHELFITTVAQAEEQAVQLLLSLSADSAMDAVELAAATLLLLQAEF